MLKYLVSAVPRLRPEQQPLRCGIRELDLDALGAAVRRVVRRDLGDRLIRAAVDDRARGLNVEPVGIEQRDVGAQTPVQEIGAQADLEVLDRLRVELRHDTAQRILVRSDAARVEAFAVVRSRP